jgi:hypothetical protein
MLGISSAMYKYFKYKNPYDLLQQWEKVQENGKMKERKRERGKRIKTLMVK